MASSDRMPPVHLDASAALREELAPDEVAVCDRTNGSSQSRAETCKRPCAMWLWNAAAGKTIRTPADFSCTTLLRAGTLLDAVTNYPLTIENCGPSMTFEYAPQNAVCLGENNPEIELMIGPEDRIAATGVLPRWKSYR